VPLERKDGSYAREIPGRDQKAFEEHTPSRYSEEKKAGGENELNNRGGQEGRRKVKKRFL